MLQVAESGLSSVMDSLLRARELAVAAAQETLSVSDVLAIEAEFAQLVAGIDDVGDRTAFNGRKVLQGSTRPTGLSSTESTIVEKLRSSWLRQSELLIEQYYGLTADGASMTITAESIDGPYGVAAYVSGSISLSDPALLAGNLELVIDVDDYTVFGDEYDAIIAHEMVHAVMNRTTNSYTTADGTTALSGTWFKEGAAEFIPGADDRVAGTLTRHSSAEVTTRAVELIGNATWGGGGVHSFSTADDYTAGYVAVRYLHDRIKSAGGTGIKDMFQYMSSVTGASVEDALQNISSGGYAGGLADFATDFGTNGQAFLDAMDLTNADTGAIGGFDADGGDVRTTVTVIPDAYDYQVQPLQNFELVWPLTNEISLEAQGSTTVATGSGDSGLEVGTFAVDQYALGLDRVELRSAAGEAIGRIDRAIDLVSEAQADVGASLTRLDSAVSAEAAAAQDLAAARGRLVDADFAAEAAAMVKASAMSRVAASLMGQMQTRDVVLLLLE